MARVESRERTAPVVLLALAGALLGGTARPVASFVVPTYFLVFLPLSGLSSQKTEQSAEGGRLLTA